MKKVAGLPIVTAEEMTRLERLALSRGVSEESLMEQAGKGVSQAIMSFLKAHSLPKDVILLAGKGNNGGDGYTAGASLLKQGVKVTAYHIDPVELLSPLCKMMKEKFVALGGTCHLIATEKQSHLPRASVIIDALLGTGFRGNVEGLLAHLINMGNHSKIPIFAIDLPSGVNGTTGDVDSVAIQAQNTLFLELPKTGLFSKKGWEHAGKLDLIPIGLKKEEILSAQPSFYLVDEEKIPFLLPPVVRTRHKYQAGYVIGVAGSQEMTGAAILSCYAALRSGAGIVRLFHSCESQGALSHAPYELINEYWNGKDLSRLQGESQRANALLIGPGMGRSEKAKKTIRLVLSHFDLPTVVDADALFFLAHAPEWELPKKTVLTPHHGEMALLLQGTPAKRSYEEIDLSECQAFAEQKNVTLVLKGAPTFIFHPQTTPLCLTRGDPGMATAGSGDVLTGMIAAMLAQGLLPQEAAVTATYLHALAGEGAAKNLTSYCMNASDLFGFIPQAFKATLKKQQMHHRGPSYY